MIDELIASGLSPELLVVVISALPIIELRGALPVAIKIFHLPWYQALCLTLIGNMLPVPFLLLFFESLAKAISRTRTGRKLVDELFKRTRRHTAAVEKYKSIGLMTLVAIPVAGTGAWTGTVAAFLCGLGLGRALLSITVGVVISGAIVTALSLMGWFGAIIAGLGFIIVAILVYGK